MSLLRLSHWGPPAFDDISILSMGPSALPFAYVFSTPINTNHTRPRRPPLERALQTPRVPVRCLNHMIGLMSPVDLEFSHKDYTIVYLSPAHLTGPEWSPSLLNVCPPFSFVLYPSSIATPSPNPLRLCPLALFLASNFTRSAMKLHKKHAENHTA